MILFSVVPPTITSTPSDTVVYTGDSYTAQCSVTGVPAPVISYFFNATNITTGVDGITVNNGVLTVASVTHDNTGPYQCFADNVRPDISPIWVVTVRDLSECLCIMNSLHLIICCAAILQFFFIFNSHKICETCMPQIFLRAWNFL